MESKLSPEQLQLYNRIDDILWRHWDPLEISKVGGSRDAYYEYLPDVYRMTVEGASQQHIAEYLHHAAREKLSLLSNREDHSEVAQMLHQLQRPNPS